jgi:hypothetical protein
LSQNSKGNNRSARASGGEPHGWPQKGVEWAGPSTEQFNGGVDLVD